MRWKGLTSSVLLTVAVLLCLTMPQTVAAAGQELSTVEKWSPVIYQEKEETDIPPQVDTFTIVNFDGDWRMNNNWINLSFHPPQMAVYYSLVETDTHYYIGYYLYYPRHMRKNQHEHDMSGMLFSITKSSDPALETLLVYSDRHWRKWSGPKVRQVSGHPLIVVSSGSHVVKAIPIDERIPAFSPAYPLTSEGEFIAAGAWNNHSWAHDGYLLVAMDELLQHRDELVREEKVSMWGLFTDKEANVNAVWPWLWNYHSSYWLAQPAELLRCLQRKPPLPDRYIYNPYSSEIYRSEMGENR